MDLLLKKPLRRLRFVTLLVLAVGLLIGGCYEDYGLTVKDFDTYLTKYVEGTNFQKYRYFIMPDTIVHIAVGILPTDPLLAARRYDSQILSLTASNLEARGYTRLSDTLQIPSGSIDSVLVVLIGQFSTEYEGYYYDYWYGYWGAWYGGWYGGYYPPAYVSSYEYTFGTNVTEIVDYGKSRAQQKFAPVWVGIISGLAGDVATAQNRISTGINRTFEQSPYLYAGQ